MQGDNVDPPQNDLNPAAPGNPYFLPPLQFSKRGALRRCQSSPARARPPLIRSPPPPLDPPERQRTSSQNSSPENRGSTSGSIPSYSPRSSSNTTGTSNTRSTPGKTNSNPATSSNTQGSSPANPLPRPNNLPLPVRQSAPLYGPVESATSSEDHSFTSALTQQVNRQIATQTSPPPEMKLRGPGQISRTKTIPFLLVSIFLVILGLVLAIEGLMIEYQWNYQMEIFYKPYWIGGIVIISGSFVLLFCCLRTPAVAVVVTTVCLPALAGSMLMLVFASLMANELIPDSEKYFCVSSAITTNTVLCKCVEDISFNVTVKGNASTAATNESCEDEVTFIFELMCVTVGVCGILIILLFTYIFWVFCAATRPTYAERRQSAYNGTMPRNGTLRSNYGGTLGGQGQYHSGTLVLQNQGTLGRQRTTSRQQSVTSARPVVTVQRTQSLAAVSLSPSRTSTLNKMRAPVPPGPQQQRGPVSPQMREPQFREPQMREPVYNNVEQDPVRMANQQRFEIPTDIHGQRFEPGQETPPTIYGEQSPPSSIPDIPEVAELREEESFREDSSDDNTTERHSFKPPAKQLSSVERKIQNMEQNLNLVKGYGKP